MSHPTISTLETSHIDAIADAGIWLAHYHASGSGEDLRSALAAASVARLAALSLIHGSVPGTRRKRWRGWYRAADTLEDQILAILAYNFPL
jgi:hypothetical protein